jgi:hypothetical protein
VAQKIALLRASLFQPSRSNDDERMADRLIGDRILAAACRRFCRISFREFQHRWTPHTGARRHSQTIFLL